MTICPYCSASVGPEDNFCEECGRSLGTGAVAPCVDAEETPRDARDHLELLISPRFAAVSDRGLVHARNEDMAVILEVSTADGIVQIAAVCDGVSTSSHPQEASRAGAEAMVNAVRDALLRGSDLEGAAWSGITAAQTAVCLCSPEGVEAGAASTLVAFLRRGSEGVLIWIGDSRAYLLNGGQGRQLTVDDSWVTEVVAAGEMTAEEAASHPYAHAITRCLGPIGREETFLPHVEAMALPAAGDLLLCSDGLWNYAEDPETLIALLAEADGDALTSCRALIDHARRRGGRDNITAALLRLG